MNPPRGTRVPPGQPYAYIYIDIYIYIYIYLSLSLYANQGFRVSQTALKTAVFEYQKEMFLV